MHVVGKPRQRVVGGDIGDDGAKRGDGAFELLDRRGIVVGAQDQVELGAEIADRLVVAGQLLGRRQRAQHFADFAQRAFDAGQRLAVGAALAGVVDAARQRADFVFDRFDRPARHRLGDGVTDFGEFAAERGDRLLDAVGTLQRLDLARDLEQMTLERGKIRARRRGRRASARGAIAGAIGGALRGGIGRGADAVEFVLARGDFRDREIERGRAERRRGTIDLGGRALDHLGLALLVLKLGRSRALRVRDLRQPRVEARDRIVQLPGDALLAAGSVVAARRSLRGWAAKSVRSGG